MSVDWTKPIQTRDGRKAEFVRVIQSGTGYTHACIIQIHGREELVSYRKSGRVLDTPGHAHPSDIINVPEEKVVGHVGISSKGVPRFYHNCHPYQEDYTHVITIKRIGDEVTATVERMG